MGTVTCPAPLIYFNKCNTLNSVSHVEVGSYGELYVIICSFFFTYSCSKDRDHLSQVIKCYVAGIN